METRIKALEWIVESTHRDNRAWAKIKAEWGVYILRIYRASHVVSVPWPQDRYPILREAIQAARNHIEKYEPEAKVGLEEK